MNNPSICYALIYGPPHLRNCAVSLRTYHVQSLLLSTNCAICYYTHPVDKITSQRVTFFAKSYECNMKQNYLTKLDIAVTIYCYLQHHVFRMVRVP